MTTDELYRQNTTDLLHIIKIQMDIIRQFNISLTDIKRIEYCTKILHNVTETQITINALP